jgi:hypothetical protein
MTFESEQKRFSLPVAPEIGFFFGDLDMKRATCLPTYPLCTCEGDMLRAVLKSMWFSSLS